jgi:hypothetical protein
MEFRLYYRGSLHTDGDRVEKQNLRRHFHRQLKQLWDQPLLADHKILFFNDQGVALSRPVRRQVGNFVCIPLVSEAVNLVAELDILFLRPQRPGSIRTSKGDIDNRLKTLIDGLRLPGPGEVHADAQPSDGEDPLYCLLENDNLVTRLAVTTDQLLDSPERSGEVLLVIHVLLKEGSGPRRFWPFP